MRNFSAYSRQRTDIFEHLFDSLFRCRRNSTGDCFDGCAQGLLSDVGIETADDGRIRAGGSKQPPLSEHRLPHRKLAKL